MRGHVASVIEATSSGVYMVLQSCSVTFVFSPAIFFIEFFFFFEDSQSTCIFFYFLLHFLGLFAVSISLQAFIFLPQVGDQSESHLFTE